MKKYPSKPKRVAEIYKDQPLYFVTMCSNERQKVLNTETVNNAFVSFAERGSSEQCVAVGRYVVMPDHIHFFVRGAFDFNLSKWVGLLKAHLTKALGNSGIKKPVWQRGFFDHIMRSSESYSEKWNYVFRNPVRKGYVDNPEEWPYAGEIVDITQV